MHRMPQLHILGEIILTRQPVRSSNLKAIGYNVETQTLEVEFLNGHVYSYAGVPAAISCGSDVRVIPWDISRRASEEGWLQVHQA